MANTNGTPGTVYIIHFERKLAHAQHYVGWTENLDQRLAAHRAGNGARLMQVISDAGIPWELAATIPGTRAIERHIKRSHNTPRWCPICTPESEVTK